MARSFDDSATYLTIGDSDAMNFPDGDWCIAGWVYANSITNPGVHSLFSHGPNTAGTMHLCISDGLLTAEVISDGWTYKWISHATSAIAAGSWYHILVRNVGDDCQLYTNGVQRANNNNAWNGISPSGVAMMGRFVPADMRYFNGCLAEWAKWDVALSDEQIAALVAGVRPTEIAARPAWYLPLLAGLEEEIAALTVTNSGSTVAEHPPAIVLPGSPHVLRTFPPGIGGPYYIATAASYLAGAAAGEIFSN